MPEAVGMRKEVRQLCTFRTAKMNTIMANYIISKKKFNESVDVVTKNMV